MWMARDKRLVNELYPRLLIAPQRSGACARSALLAIWGARGAIVRTRTTVLQAHTHQWLGTFSGAGNGDYRGELLRAAKVISTYVKAQSVPLSQAVVRLDGQYGNGAIVADLKGLAYVMRGKDYHLLDLPAVQARLQAPPDQQTTHPETGTQRALFDFPGLEVTATG